MKNGRGWWIAYAVCAVAALLPLLTTYRLPMADLPQHAAQLTVWKHYDDACYRFAQSYFVNWATPYVIGVACMHAIAAFMPISAALKLVVYLTILALPLVMLRLTAFSDLDPYLALLGFPLSFGFTFYWGFINFNFTIPLLLLLVLYSCKGDWRAIAVMSVVVAAAHGFAYVIGLCMCAPLLIRKRALFALLIPAPFLGLWFFAVHSTQARARAPVQWLMTPVRPLQLLDFALSAGTDPGALGFATVLLLIAILAGVAPARERWRWIPAGVAAVAFVVMPFGMAGQTFLYPRLTLIAWASAIIALRPRAPLIRRPAVRTLIVATSVLWMVILAFRFSGFHRDADGFDALVDSMPSNHRVLLLNVVQSDEITGMPFLHFSGYYLERKGGAIGWSFASNFPNVVRHRPGADRGVPPIVTHDPRYFDWKRDGDFDFFVVRAPVDMTRLIFRDAGDAIRLRQRAGNWWLYEKSARPSQCAPIEPDRDHQPLLRW